MQIPPYSANISVRPVLTASMGKQPVHFGEQPDEWKKARKASRKSFIPARPNRLVQRLVQWKNKYNMTTQGLHIEIPCADMERLKALPRDVGIVLVANHTASLDRQAMLELSRRWGRSVVAMGAKDAFDAMKPLERWIYQRLGVFSVGSGEEARSGRRYVRHVLNTRQHAVLIFPEGEESYRTDGLLPFRYGAARDIVEVAGWVKHPVYVVPLALRYEYGDKLSDILKDSLAALEGELGLTSGAAEAADPRARYHSLVAGILARWEKEYDMPAPPDNQSLTERLERFPETLVSGLEARYGMKNRFPEMSTRLERILNLINKRQPEPLRADVQAVQLLRRLLIFPGGSLDPDADLPSVAWGVSHLELLLLKKWPPSAMDAVKTIRISVREPINARMIALTNKRRFYQGVEQLIQTMRKAIQAGLGLE